MNENAEPVRPTAVDMSVRFSLRHTPDVAGARPLIQRTYQRGARQNNRYSRGADFTICPRLVKDTPWFPLSPNITASIKG